jgi:hypothetical protein
MMRSIIIIIIITIIMEKDQISFGSHESLEGDASCD